MAGNSAWPSHGIAGGFSSHRADYGRATPKFWRTFHVVFNMFNGDVTNNIRSGDVGMYGPPKNDGFNDEPLDFNINHGCGSGTRYKWTQKWAYHFQSETIHLGNSHFDPRLDLILISPNQPLGLARTHGSVGGCSPHAGEHTAGRVGSFQLFMGMGTPRNIGIRWRMGASGQEQAEWDQVFDGEMKAGGLRAS